MIRSILVSLFLGLSIFLHAEVPSVLDDTAFFDQLENSDGSVKEKPATETKTSSGSKWFQYSSFEDDLGWHTLFDEKYADFFKDQLGDREKVQEAIIKRLSGVPSPLGDKPLRKVRKGYVYTAYHWKDKLGTGLAHQGFLKDAQPDWDSFPESIVAGTEVTAKGSPTRFKFLFECFRQISRWEGDTSSINSWDNQKLTIGAGFSGMAYGTDWKKDGVRFVGKIMCLMPQAYKQRLYEHGIRIREDRTLTILDPKAGKLYHGNDALEFIRKQEPMLRLLIQLAQSDEKVEHNGFRKSFRQWMLEVQFFIYSQGGSARFAEGTEFDMKSTNALQKAAYAAHIAHGGRYSVGSMMRQGSMEAILEKALGAYKGREEEMRRMYNHHRSFYSKNKALWVYSEDE